MPWLADLVQSSESSLSALPLQCLCEFLLMKQNINKNNTQTGAEDKPKQKSIKNKVAGRLHNLLFGPEASRDGVSKLIQYFVNLWSSPLLKDRESSRFELDSLSVFQGFISKSYVDIHLIIIFRLC